ncbi:class I SAM-dependent methyltransferase [Flavobacterium psychrophilum]|uniref:Class I SAM-dependent methyltransferase n=1 Tax=Flavobacterium psychrophilum TaxID=96345 RepID=A0A7U2NFX1_FLAPS|nr:class I SAM-dependent methyltransferase [Flavobacterium psychrophilum]AIN72957.1 methyltransferase [Flavobacterium psychrophilum FPG3]EKT2069150.1 class I SAM-dependent methyltransferase [Flavobacterium psychrophilum]EKT2071248.1 class I SAM-dependent methyltransferase [Flavobacterium psychrophilum]EKT3967241.1 class I SAM-dependent methyltransferase [Flavobacterium psychrophilum]EKT4490768.1 class I SAM-dependent methyltransferase [Flavobacterium psychrophilum]
MNFQTHSVFIKVKDNSISKESFELLIDEELQLLKTHPQPLLDILPKYYESEDYISHTDGKRSLFEKMYQIVKSYSLNKKVSLINTLHLQKGSLLDIGAGTGDFLATAKKQGWQITGIEPNEKAKIISISKGVSFAENLESISSHSFDVITMWHVLEHVPDLENQIKLLKRLLKPNGTIIIAVPNYKSFDAKYYGEFWAAYDVPRHLWHFSKTAIEKLFANENMKLIKMLPMIFDSFYVSLLSEKYKNGKMNFIKAFYIGLKSNMKAKRNLEYSSHIYVIKNS